MIEVPGEVAGKGPGLRRFIWCLAALTRQRVKLPAMKSSIAPAHKALSLVLARLARSGRPCRIRPIALPTMLVWSMLALGAGAGNLAYAQSIPAETTGNTGQTANDRQSVRLQNDAIESIKSALDGRRATEALQVAEKALKQFPGNVQMRFLYGVALADSGQTEQAIEHFEAFVLNHPELAEPYNNLAVLYASQGDLKAARDALESAITNGPAYTLAYENLGDVYLRLAKQAYETGSLADGATPAVRRKLVLTRSLVEQVSPNTTR